jgi:hypothetical protein
MTTWGLTLLATSGLLAGCNPLGEPRETSSSTTDWENSTDLTSDYGGYTFTDEAAGFGDTEVQKLDLEESAMSVADSDTVVTPNAFLVRIVWGQLEGNPEATQVIDWSGAFAVSSGRLTVLRTLAFEPSTDKVLPRDDRQVVPFESLTLPHFDGLLLMVHDPDNDTAATLAMRTAPYSGSWTFEELRRANEIIPVDDLGNAVSITGIPLPDDPGCLGGAMRGHWMHRAGQRGAFRGVVQARLGEPLGHIRGHFGVNDAGERVWFGKIIDRDGRLIGLARGGFQPDPTGPGGQFTGHWAVQEGQRNGSIVGHYMPGTAAGRSLGHFQARWRSNCDGDPEPLPDDTAF